MDLAHAELTRILALENTHAWAVTDEGNDTTVTDEGNDTNQLTDNKSVDQEEHRYYFLDQAGKSSRHGDTALHRLLALHAPPSAVHNYLHHAAQHRQQLLATVTSSSTCTTNYTDGDDDNDTQQSRYDNDSDVNISVAVYADYSHVTVSPPMLCDGNDCGVTALHVAVHRNSWHVVEFVDCLLHAFPTLASTPMKESKTYPLHIVMGHNITIQESVFYSLIQADPAVAAKQDYRGDTPLSLLWKNNLRFRWARAWELFNTVPDYTTGDLSWITVISPE